MQKLFICFILGFLTVNAQSISSLDSTDFIVAGIKDDLDSVTVKKILGKPTSILILDNPFDEDAKLIIWNYPDLQINLGSENSTCGVTLTSKKYMTKRGLRIGDTIDKAIKIYGEPDSRYSDRLNYFVPESELHAIQVRLKNGKVTEIFLGWFLD